MRTFPVLSTQMWGVLCGGALGAVRTREAALHLLAKNRVLEAGGLVPLPGAGHWEMMGSSAPAWVGGLFFGLSLGLGAAALGAVWCRVAGLLPGRAGRWAPLLVLAAPVAAGVTGDPALAATLLAIALGALAIDHIAHPPTFLPVQLLMLGVLGLGLMPWATAEEGPFTRLRDQVLFAGPAGLAVDQFYYRWTLYPAEVLKPLAAKTQPTAVVGAAVPASDRQQFCAAARRLGALCVDEALGEDGGDLRVETAGAGLALVAGTTRVPWPAGAAEQREAWQGFSAARDGSVTLRRATGIALFLGCPLGLCWLLGSLALGLAAGVPGRRRRHLATLGIAVALAAAVATAGRADPEVAALRAGLAPSPSHNLAGLAAQLDSPRAVERFYAAHAARHLGSAAEAVLLEALLDPVINVRYAAAQGLGEVGGESARITLDEVLHQPEEWYVKERAYASLQRLGRPRR